MRGRRGFTIDMDREEFWPTANLHGGKRFHRAGPVDAGQGYGFAGSTPHDAVER